MSPQRKITIYGLSRELGLSPATISKALGNASGVSAATRLRVRAAAEAHGFRPRPISRRITNICALIQGVEDQREIFSYFVDSVMDGIWKYVNENDLEMSLYSGTVAKLNDINLVRTLYRMNVDGVVVINATSESNYYADFERQKLPYCSVLSNNGRNRKWMLNVDNADAACRAVTHLMDMGHRQIAMLLHAPHNQTGQDRLTGYLNALSERRIPFQKSLVIHPLSQGDEGVAFGYNGTRRLLAARPDATAILVLDQQIAVGVLRALDELQKRVPGDVSVLSFDDSPIAPYLHPPLTVMRIPNAELGYAAARWVHRQIKDGVGRGEYAPESWMRGELIVRASTGPVPG